MRRLDFHPKRRLRNPGRHLRSLARWPERIITQLPTNAELEGSAFSNFRIPAYAKLLEPPHTRPEWLAAALQSVFAAAEAVERSPRKPEGVRVACLVTTPGLINSEVTLFADESYFQSFLPVAKSSRSEWEGGWVEGRAARPEELPEWIPPAPEGLRFMGGNVITEGEHAAPGEAEATGLSRIEWVWAFDRS